jgi:hypothetical protein
MGTKGSANAGVSIRLKTYVVADLPAAADHVNEVVIISNGAAGAKTLGYSDGTNWIASGTGLTAAAA